MVDSTSIQTTTSNHHHGRELNLIRSTLSGWCGAAYLLLWTLLFRPGTPTPTTPTDTATSNAPAPHVKATWLTVGLFLTMFAAEAWTLHRAHKGLLTAPTQRAISAGRLGQKLVGWVVTYLVVCVPYWLFPEYRGSFYDRYYAALWDYGPLWVLFFLVCIVVDDVKNEVAWDTYYQLGRAVVTLRPAELPAWPVVKQHFLGWLVKLYFLPLMFVYLTNYMTSLKLDFRTTTAGYETLYTLTFFTDTAFAVVGYAFGNKMLDSHLRSTEPTAFGWTIALMCYQPFWGVIGGQYIVYGGAWGVWLGGAAPWVRTLWATAILVCEALYVWATIAFGTRFSNLTHRGVITVGPYYFLKVCAFVFACLIH